MNSRRARGTRSWFREPRESVVRKALQSWTVPFDELRSRDHMSAGSSGCQAVEDADFDCSKSGSGNSLGGAFAQGNRQTKNSAAANGPEMFRKPAPYASDAAGRSLLFTVPRKPSTHPSEVRHRFLQRSRMAVSRADFKYSITFGPSFRLALSSAAAMARTANLSMAAWLSSPWPRATWPTGLQRCQLCLAAHLVPDLLDVISCACAPGPTAPACRETLY